MLRPPSLNIASAVVESDSTRGQQILSRSPVSARSARTAASPRVRRAKHTPRRRSPRSQGLPLPALGGTDKDDALYSRSKSVQADKRIEEQASRLHARLSHLQHVEERLQLRLRQQQEEQQRRCSVHAERVESKNQIRLARERERARASAALRRKKFDAKKQQAQKAASHVAKVEQNLAYREEKRRIAQLLEDRRREDVELCRSLKEHTQSTHKRAMGRIRRAKQKQIAEMKRERRRYLHKRQRERQRKTEEIEMMQEREAELLRAIKLRELDIEARTIDFDLAMLYHQR